MTHLETTAHLYIPSFTAESHYTSLSDDEYVVGNPIEIQTISDSKLERPRQFEVKLSYSVSTPLVVVEPDTVIVTIKDRDGMLPA